MLIPPAPSATVAQTLGCLRLSRLIELSSFLKNAAVLRHTRSTSGPIEKVQFGHTATA